MQSVYLQRIMKKNTAKGYEKTNPIQTQFKPKQTQSKPVLSAVELGNFPQEMTKIPIYLPAIDLFQLYQCDPVFIGVFGYIADGNWAGAGYLSHGAFLQLAADTWIIPLYGEGVGVIAQIEICCSAGQQINGIDLADLCKTIVVSDGG